MAAPAFKSDADQVPQDWGRLADYLDRQGFSMSRADPPRQFAGGFGNLNYLLEIDGRATVLRRPPLGPIPPGANDMRREHRILGTLWQGYPLAPRSIHFCEDAAVLGAPFFLMEYRPGIVIGGRLPESVAGRGDVGTGLGAMLVERLAELHAVDPAAVGLDGFGRPEGFLARTAEGWAKRAELAWEGDFPAAGRKAIEWLRANVRVADQAPTLLHNDFKLDNFVLDPETLAPVALLDWDLGTRGDPLVDLGVLLSYWTEAGDPPAMQELGQMPTAGHDFPRRAEVVQRYARLTGRDVSDILYYRVLAAFRLAVVFMQLHRRYREGGATDPRFARFGGLADGLLAFTHDILRGRVF